MDWKLALEPSRRMGSGVLAGHRSAPTSRSGAQPKASTERVRTRPPGPAAGNSQVLAMRREKRRSMADAKGFTKEAVGQFCRATFGFL